MFSLPAVLFPKKKIFLVLTSFKHSMRPAKFLLPRCENAVYCPKAALLDLLVVRPVSPGPLFVNGKGACISRYSVNKVLKDCLRERGYDTLRFNTHSFRVGRASDLAIKGASERLIKETGRWNSNAFLDYLRFDLFQLPH